MGSQQLILKWNLHSTNLLGVFDELLYNEDFVDVTLACEGKKLKAHKVVLSAASPYFRDLLHDNPCKHPIVILRETKFSVLKNIIDFMYKGEINVFEDQLELLLKTAQSLMVRGLEEIAARKPDIEDDLSTDMLMSPENSKADSEMGDTLTLNRTKSYREALRNVSFLSTSGSQSSIKICRPKIIGSIEIDNGGSSYQGSYESSQCQSKDTPMKRMRVENEILSDGSALHKGNMLNQSYTGSSSMEVQSVGSAEVFENACVLDPSVINSLLENAKGVNNDSYHKVDETNRVVTGSDNTLKTKNPKSSRKGPLTVPVFSFIVQSKLAVHDLATVYNRFVRECAGHFLKECPNPTKYDYEEFSEIISHSFPVVRDGSGSTKSFRMQLSKTIRNQKYRERVQGIKYSAPAKSKTVSDAQQFYDHSTQVPPTDAQISFTNELKQIFIENKNEVDNKHVMLLLHETFNLRRTEIKTMASCSEILNEYKFFQEEFWLKYEFSLIVKKEEEERRMKYNEILNKLSNLFLIPIHGSWTHYEVLLQLEKCVKGNESEKSPIVIKQVGDPIEGHLYQYPVLAIYKEPDGNDVMEALILAEGNILYKMEDKSPFSLIDMLMAVYCVFDVQYPEDYSGFLCFLLEILYDYGVLETTLAKNLRLASFLAKYRSI